MNLQQLLSYVRRACDDYRMIQPNDKIVVAVSGGKDSLATLSALAALRRFYPQPYTLSAMTVDLGLPGFNTEPVAKWCESLQVPYTVLKTDIGQIIFDVRAEKNPCSLCAKMRKGVLNGEAVRSGCTRVAYGHNRDDIIHTFLLSLFYEGRLHTLSPVTWLDKTGLFSIRPLMYVPEQEIIGYAKKEQLPVVKSPCPVDGQTKRAEMAQWVSELRKRYDHFDEKVFTALTRLFSME